MRALRNGFKWNVNECLQLHREYELLDLSIDEIAIKHKRTPNAIMCKLSSEGFADYNSLYNTYYSVMSNIITYGNDCNKECDDEYTDDCDDEYTDDCDGEYTDDCDGECDKTTNLFERIMRLEKQVQSLTNIIMSKNSNKSVFSLFS